MNWFLTDSRYLRLASFTIFYIGQGIPIGLISIALPIWLAAQEVSGVDIALFVSITGLPWGLKLFAGPIMDRYTFLAMGRRRPWIIAAQTGLVLAMLGLALVPDPVNNFTVLTVMAFCVNCFAAVQDVAIDGWRGRQKMNMGRPTRSWLLDRLRVLPCRAHSVRPPWSCSAC